MLPMEEAKVREVAVFGGELGECDAKAWQLIRARGTLELHDPGGAECVGLDSNAPDHRLLTLRLPIGRYLGLLA